ncbi:iron-containing alcohol dehydrogenase [[Clostridium] scindens]
MTVSNLAGIAFGNAGTGAVHAMSYPLSGVCHCSRWQKYTEGYISPLLH